jgi:single-strand DNA-binding protein
MNSVKLIGNVGAQVNIMNFEKSKKASFNLATTESFKDRNNQDVKTTAWHNIIAWGKLAEVCETLVSKGKSVSVEGKLVYRNYTNSQNQKVYITEIQAYKVEEYVYEKK